MKRSLWLIVAAFLCLLPIQAQAACDYEIGESGTSNAKIITDVNEELLCIQTAVGDFDLSGYAQLDAANTFTQTQEIKLENDNAGFGPVWQWTRISLTPAASDGLGYLQFIGNNASLSAVEYASIGAVIVDTTAGSVDGRLQLRTTVNNTNAGRLNVAQGTFAQGLSDMGAATANFSDYYDDGVSLASIYQGLDSDLTAIAALTTNAAGRSLLTLSDPNADRIPWWDDSDGSVEWMTLADIATEASPASGDYLLMIDAAGDLKKVDWDDLPSGGGSVSDGDKGDIVVSSSGTVWSLDMSTTVTAFGSGDKFPCFESGVIKACDYDDLPGAGSGMSDLVDDTTPQLGGNLDANSFNIGFDDNTGITDDSGNEQLLFQKNASAVNFVEIENGASNVNPIIRGTGDSTNVGLSFVAKASGTYSFTSASNSPFKIVDTDSGASGGPNLILLRDSSSPADADGGPGLLFNGKDTVGTETTYAQITARLDDVDDGTEDGWLRFYVMAAGTLTEQIQLRGAVLPSLVVLGTDDGSGGGPDLTLSRTSASPAANDLLGIVNFRGLDSAASVTLYSQIYGQILDPTDGSEDGAILFNTYVAGSTTTRLKIAQGLYYQGGSDQGLGTGNFTGLYVNGTNLTSLYQPLDSDLTAIAALTTTTGGRGLLTLSDPNADTITCWDDSAGAFVNCTIGSGLQMSGTTISATGGGRTVLSGNQTYYVRTDGSDSNTCTTDSSGGACLTIQGAVDKAALLDFAGYTVTIQVKDGTFTGSTTLKPMVGMDGAEDLVIQGNSGTPANVIISTTSANDFTAGEGVLATIKDMELRTTTSGNGIASTDGAVIEFTNLRFGATATSHMVASRGGRIRATGNYTVSGGAAIHGNANQGGGIDLSSVTITFSGTPSITTGLNAASLGVVSVSGASFSGTYTGADGAATLNGVIINGTAFPGSGSTSTSTGGQIS